MEQGARAAPVALIDVAVSAASVAASLAILAVGAEETARDPDRVSTVLLVLLSVPLLLRRHWPVAVFGAVLAISLVYLGLDYPGGAELPPILAGLYAVAAAGHRHWTVALTAAFVGLGTVHRLLVEGEGALIVTIGVSLLLVVALLGDSVHTSRRLRAETRERLRVAEAEKESEARARVAEERLRIARELHDVMAHTIATMSVQAGAVADLLEHRPDRAREPLAGMRATAREATAELHAIISLLRDDAHDGREPPPRLDRLDDLLRRVRDAGLDARIDVSGADDRGLPAAIDLTCYRIIQEALTNVIRHADARHAEVRLAYQPDAVTIEVTDGGRGPAPSGPDGYGLRGLRERAAALGGELQAGAGPDGGFRVHAVLPREGRR